MASSSSTMQNPSSSQQRQQPVLSLLEKYSSLHNGIEKAREETQQCQTQIQNAEARIVRLMESRRQMIAQTKASKEQQQQLLQDTDDTLQESLKFEKECEEVVSKKNKAKASLDAARQREIQYRQDFVETSKAFRESCRQLCIQGEKVGLTPFEPYALTKNKHDFFKAFQGVSQLPNDDDKYHAERMKSLQEQLYLQTKSYESEKKERDELAARKMQLAQKSQKTKAQQSTLQAQLDRIQNDVSDLNLQIAETRQLSEEAQATAANFEKEARHRSDVATGNTRGRVLPSRNPYANIVSTRLGRSISSNNSSDTDQEQPVGGRNSSSRPQQKRSAKRKRKAQGQQRQQVEQGRPQPNPSSSKTTTSQYPHRVGKVRSSRGFGLSLRLSNPTVGSGSHSLSPETVPPTAAAEVAHVTPAPNGTAAANKSKTVARHFPFIPDDDDDDDDDGLLSFVAFGSSK